ncbi:MAG TPA: hypothetical protein VGY55_22765 [Pirellulales bacterium]|jgi:hypothetical protein|nr:hypothetical protein [Pirellulales bacterium]
MHRIPIYWTRSSKLVKQNSANRRYNLRVGDSDLSRCRLFVILATIGINVVAVSLLVFAPWSGWRTALALNLIDNALLLGFMLRYRDVLMARLIVFGLSAGVVELVADAWLVGITGTLDYSIGGGPMLWRSPVWMPAAWEVVSVQFGYVGLRLWERFGASGLLLNGILGAINIPFYEEMARRTHWWQYSGCRMISGTPWYIILGEFAIAVLLGLLAIFVKRGGWRTSIAAGAAGGAGIFVAYAVAFTLIEGWPRR